MEVIIGIGIFITIVLLIEAGFVIISTIRNSESRRMRKMLRTLSAGGTDIGDVEIVRKRIFSEIPWFNRALLILTQTHRVDRLLEQANTRMTLGFFLLLSFCIASFAYLGGYVLHLNGVAAFVLAVLLGLTPFAYLRIRKQKRMDRFQEQLPDALDLVARALRAGHAFSGGLKMVADEFDDPVGTEFGKTLNEINFGIGVEESMKNFAGRIDSTDLRFFVVSVIIQRETGGNLAEILEKIAYIIRERFKLYGRVRVLAAEGTLSAVVLIFMPPLIAFYIFLVNREYLETLYTDPIGIAMTAFALVLMCAGVLVMRKMIRINV